MYEKRFKEEKTIIVRYDDTMATLAFRKKLPSNHLILGELIIGENLTLVDYYALAKKHLLCDEERRAQNTLEQSWKDLEAAQKKTSKK